MTDSILFDNIYIGTSESDLAQFVSETYAIKAPLEAAQEAAETAKEEAESEKAMKKLNLGDEPDYKVDPVGWARFKAQQFFDEAVVDPKKALVENPLTGGVLGVVFASIIGMIGVRASSRSFLVNSSPH